MFPYLPPAIHPWRKRGNDIADSFFQRMERGKAMRGEDKEHVRGLDRNFNPASHVTTLPAPTNTFR